MTTPQQPIAVERPTIGLEIGQKGNETTPRGTPKMMISIVVFTAMTKYQAYLCDADDAEEAAALWSERILEAQKEAKRLQSGLVVAEGPIANGSGLQKQGQVQRRSRSKG